MKAWLLCIVSAAAGGFGKTDIASECVDKAAFDRPAAAVSLLSKSSTVRHSGAVEEEAAQLSMKSTLQSFDLSGKLASLLEQSSALLGGAGVDITPGVNETLRTLIETIQDSILDNIRHHHEGTQQTVRSKVSDLRQKTNRAVGAHTEATDTDIDYVQCMRNLASCQGSHAHCTTRLGDMHSAADTSCAESHAKRFYKSNESVHAQSIPELECDYALPRRECKFDDFKSALANWADTMIQPELEANRSNYDRAHRICSQHQNDVHNQSQNCTDTRNNCVATELSCKELETRRDVSMCTFGDKLQQKCASKTSYDDLAANIRGTGSVHSDPDRRHEWMSAELIKCMLHDHRMGADFDNTTMQRCEPLSNYSRDVGVLDLQMDNVRNLTSAENFDCIQTKVNFSGVEVVMTPGTPDPTYNFFTPYSPAVNLTLGTVAFGICATSTDSKFCGLDFINQTCPADWQLKPQQNHTPCALSSRCTFADCCEQV